MKRRDLIKGTIATGLVAGCGLGPRLAAASPVDNPIVRENANVGSTDWQLTRVRTDTRGGVRSSFIEGYCSRQSVAAGESIDIHVSTKPVPEFTIEIFRTGYYDGRGARLMKTIGPLQGKTQPTPEYGPKRLRECQWEKSVTLDIPSDWTSGVYVGRLTTLSDASGHGYWQEYPMAYWLEQHGYDVAYCSNSDMLTPDRGMKCKAFLSVGHDEYWDLRQYHSVVAMRDAGVNLMFLSGNSVCWVSPFRNSHDGRRNRIIFRGGPYGGAYKLASQREKQHGPFPHRGPDEGYLMGARNVDPVNGGGDWVCTLPDHWIYARTGMQQGERIPGLIGWEYHGDPASDIDGLQIVAEGMALQGGVIPQRWTATIYPGPKGNFVFNASTIWWCQDLASPPGHQLPWSHWSRPHGPDSRVERITQNLLRKALAD